jgi:hypothetical protein
VAARRVADDGDAVEIKAILTRNRPNVIHGA